MTSTGITFTPDGNGSLYCSLCGINGAPIVDAVIHADWHDTYDDRLWNAGYAQCSVEWTTWDVMLTPTERNGVRKVTDELTKRMNGARR